MDTLEAEGIEVEDDIESSNGEFFFFLVVNHLVSRDRIGSRLIRIRSVVTVKALYPSQIVCLVGIELESSFHKLSLRCQLSHNYLVK